MSKCLMSKTGHECFKDILDQFPVPVVIAGFGDGPIYYMNDHTRALLRINNESDDFINTCDFYVDPVVRKGFVGAVVSSGIAKDYEIEFKDSFGTRFWGMVSSKIIKYNGLDSILSTIIDITARKTLERELLHSSKFDYLTGVYNRAYFVEFFEKELIRARRYEHELSMVMIDADNFKRVNDNHGHIVGDQVLKWLCSAIGTSLRKTDVFGRIGGEEFAILLPETGPEGATKLAERIRASVEEAKFTSKAVSMNMTISLGVSSLADQDDGDSLFKRSDDALLEAKTGVKNRVVFR